MIIAVNTRFLLKDQLEGIGWFTYETLQRLVKRYPQHQFIFFFDRPFDQRYVFADNVKPIVLFPPARHPLLFYIWFEYAVANALKKYKADLFLSTDNFLSLRTSVPTLLVVHDLSFIHFPNQVKYWEQRYYNYFMPKFVAKAARIATVSEYTKQDIKQQFDIPLDKIDVVFNGVRKIFQPLSEVQKKAIKREYSESEDYFFYIGAVHPRKNVHRMIAAFDGFKKATNTKTKFLIAGRFAWQTESIKLAYERAKHKKDILFLNYLPDNEVPLLMGSALAFVYVSLFEGFGIPLLEAMNCDVPILTSNVSSMPEVVGQAGLTVPPDSTDAIKEAMIRLCRDETLRDKLMQHGQRQRQKFSWDTTTDYLEKSIRKIIEL